MSSNSEAGAPAPMPAARVSAGQSGRIVLAATPIGDRMDASPRLCELLAEADLIAAEDTRRLRRLLVGLGITPRGHVVAHHDHNESRSAAGLVQRALAGATVLIVSDAGMPSVSDPGYRVVREAIEAGVIVTCVPGPSAVLAALAVSGLPTDRFSFEGFAARKPGERSRALQSLAQEPRTMVFFEAPHRVRSLLQAMAETFGQDRQAALCRELTKTHEEVVRGTLAELLKWSEREVLGEITLVVAGAPPASVALAELVVDVETLRRTGISLREAARRVSRGTGVSTRDLYEAVIAAGGSRG
ncbi:MAG: 16S rRNA (cytidine(1402)-2'-O)-methyltransferase [Actinomycetales bacterium]